MIKREYTRIFRLNAATNPNKPNIMTNAKANEFSMGLMVSAILSMFGFSSFYLIFCTNIKGIQDFRATQFCGGFHL